ncbi:MAG TPA: VOC family protein [Blastocatellia bacterium]|jgi:PhnB protein|nr:VOC family protein [Blastocatellia bacterium]
MAKGSLIEQLDQAVEAMLANPDAPLPRVNARVAAPLRIAAELRHLPRADFKARLKADLEGRTSMTTTAVKAIREGFHTITPYLIVQDAAALIDFMKQAFGAQELYRGTGSAGGIHAEVKIGDSMVMIGGGEVLSRPSMPAAIHLYVKDADAVYKSALEAGAAEIRAPVDQDYGDREASVKDQAGNLWYIATHKATGHMPEGLRSVTPYLHPRGAPQMIDFLQRAFGAEEKFRHQSPDGVIHHASIGIGDSVIEMGEAHGEAQPMPTTFFLYVDDVDSLYQRAVEAGAASQMPPADQPYGDRVAGVTDPFDNVWYIATHIRDTPV